MIGQSFTLLLEKIEVVILTKMGFPTLRPISTGALIIELKPTIKYLGLTLNSEMSFPEQKSSSGQGYRSFDHMSANGKRYGVCSSLRYEVMLVARDCILSI